MPGEFRSCLILGVKPGADAAEIRRAYRRLALRWHPDGVQGDSRAKREAESRFRAIHEAYRALMAPDRTVSVGAGNRPAAPGYDPAGWRQSAAETGRAAESMEDDPTYYGRAIDLHFQGVEHYAARRYREAISSLTQSVCLVQNNPEAYRLLGRAHRRLNQPAKAIAAYRTAARIEPDSADTRYELGEALLAASDRAGALEETAALERLDSELARLLRDSIERAEDGS